jgi:GTP cyclohydrolase FolE2
VLLEVEEMTLLGVMAGDAEELAAAEEEAEAVLEAGAESGIVSVAVEMIGGRESTITGRESDAAVAVVVWTAMRAEMVRGSSWRNNMVVVEEVVRSICPMAGAK